MVKKITKLERNIIISCSTILIITLAFSLPIGSFPIFGSLLFPGGGFWESDLEVTEYEKLTIASLNHDVTIYRDEWGVPHIYASTEEDAIFAMGYCQAQDRLFMMEMARRSPW